MSQASWRRLLSCHKVLKLKLTSLGLQTYEDAAKLLGNDFVEPARILGRLYTLTVHADEFDNEIVVGVWLERRALPCSEGYGVGYSFTRNANPRYLSQKDLWAHGY